MQKQTDLSPSSVKWVWAALAIYVHLWIIEGAVRKWIPNTDQVFYILRDGLAILAILIILLSGISIRQRSHAVLLLFIILTSFVGLQIIFVPVDPVIAGVGLRSYLAPILFASILYLCPVKDFALKITQIILRYSPVQMLLVILQVRSGPESAINKLVSSDQAYFVNDGIVRATGTFSAPSGLSLYGGLVLALALWKFQESQQSRLFVKITYLVISIAIVTLSGSRSALLSGAIVLSIFVMVQVRRSSGPGLRILVGTAALLGIALVVSMLAFPEVITSFTSRITTAAIAEDSGARLVTDATGFIFHPLSFIGSGAGVNSQAGIGLGSTGKWIEVDSLRWVAELGLLGWCLAIARFSAGLVLFARLLIRGPRLGMLHLMVTAIFIPVLAYGSVTQNPTSQAFFSICLGLLFITFDRENQTMTTLARSTRHLGHKGNSHIISR